MKVQLFLVRVDWCKSFHQWKNQKNQAKNHMQFWSFVWFVWHINWYSNRFHLLTLQWPRLAGPFLAKNLQLLELESCSNPLQIQQVF